MEIEGSDFASLIQRSAELTAASRERFEAANQDLLQLEQALPARRTALERLAEREETKELELDPDLLSVERLDERVAAIKLELDALGRRMAAAWARLDGLTGDVELPPAEHRAQLTGALTELSGALLELSLLQARARLDAITFEPVELTAEEGYCIASRYRRDWMNARAALVDSWRLIHFNANDLESDLDLVFSGDIGNVGDNPFDLRASNGRLRVGLEFDAPLTRLAERNVYRQSLIEYQQARRSYYQFRDRVQRNVRSTLRQLRLDDLNFEIRRAAVHVAITQVDLARLRLSEPARPVTPGLPGQPTQPGGGAQFGATVARDLVNALIDLLNVQNDFLSVWVDHEVQHLNLDFELGIMELDGRGIRIPHDQPLRTYLTEAPCRVPCELPDACSDVPAQPASEAAVKRFELLPEPQPTGSSANAEKMVPRPSPPPRLETAPSIERPADSPGPELLPPPAKTSDLPAFGA
jgi:hypothetical protein